MASEPKLPPEFIDYIVQEVYKKFGDQLVERINEKVKEIVDPLWAEVNKLKEEVRFMKAMGAGSMKEFIRTTIEVSSSEIAKSAASEVVQQLGLDEVKDAVNSAKQLLMDINERVSEFVDKSNVMMGNIESFENRISDLSKKLDGINSTILKIQSTIETEVRKVIEESIEEIRSNIVVDRTLIEKAVENVVRGKISRIEQEISSIKDTVVNLDAKIEDLMTSVNILLDRSESGIKEAIEAKKVEQEAGVKNVFLK